MKWDKIISYCQIAGVLLAYYNLVVVIFIFPEISGFALVAFFMAFILYTLGLVSAFIVLQGKKGGIILSTIFWVLQIPYISFQGFTLSFYALLLFALGIDFESGLFFRFRIESSFYIEVGEQSTAEVLAINLIPFIVMLQWAKMGAYNKE